MPDKKSPPAGQEQERIEKLERDLWITRITVTVQSVLIAWLSWRIKTVSCNLLGLTYTFFGHMEQVNDFMQQLISLLR